MTTDSNEQQYAGMLFLGWDENKGTQPTIGKMASSL